MSDRSGWKSYVGGVSRAGHEAAARAGDERTDQPHPGRARLLNEAWAGCAREEGRGVEAPVTVHCVCGKNICE